MDTDTPNELDGKQEPGGGGGGGGGVLQGLSPQFGGEAPSAKPPPITTAIRNTAHTLIEQLIFFIFSSLKKA
jgi:hypothetical protein